MKKQSPCCIFLLAIVITFTRPLSAQDRFNVGATVGLNAAQIDGDDQSGYRQTGINAGLIGTAELSERVYLSVGLLYSQRGSKPNDGRSTFGEREVTIRLNYAEVPVLINLRTSENWDGFYRVHLSTGISFSRLLNYEVTESMPFNPSFDILTYQEMSDFFNSSDLGLLFGATLYVNDHIGLGISHSLSLNRLFDKDDIPDKEAKSLQSYFLTVRGIYML